jgi:hypothetical protein
MTYPPSQEAKSGFQALRELVRKQPSGELCDLCAVPVRPVHQHLLERTSRALVCACDACAVLFSASDTKFLRVPRRIRLIQDFHLPDQLWEDLAVPINMAYFYSDSVAGRAKASYPSPAGAVESLLPLDAWRELAAANPILDTVEPDVEALLANRLGIISGSAGMEYFLLPIDECYKLVGLIRTHWRGLSGGTEVWKELMHFFSVLRERAHLVEGAKSA